MNATTRVGVVKYADRKNLVLRWTDPEDGRLRTKSAGTSRRRDAERTAAKLESEIAEGKFSATASVTWQEFRTSYEEDWLSGLADRTFSIVQTVFKAVERHCGPRLLTDVNAVRITAMQTALRREGKSESTIACYSRHLLSSLNWAHEQGLLVNVPKVNMPRRGREQKLMKGRPITGEEFDRLLMDTPKTVGEDAAGSWQYYLEGLWTSGMRLEESLTLRWDDAPGSIVVDLTGRHPMLRIPGSCQKSGRDQLYAMAPEFAEFLLQTPEAERRGRVFKLEAPSGRGTWAMRSDTVSAIVRRIGKAALVVVDERARGKKLHTKYASAHDLRRSFGERWALRVMPQVLMELMRHESIETTQKYYVGRNAQRTADVLWAVDRASSEPKRNISVTTANQGSAADDLDSTEALTSSTLS